VAVDAARAGADLVHGLHVEAPPAHVPVVVTIHDLIPLDHPASMPDPLARAVYRRVLRSSLARAARVIVPSPATAERLAALAVDGDRVDVVPLGVGPEFRPSSPVERDAARRRFAAGRRYVVASTGPKAHKNRAGLDRAAALLPPDVVVASTGGALDDADLPAFYGGADAMVLPAFVEGYGLPAVEALACGVPVVCGARTGALAFIGPGVLEVDVADPHELAAGIRTLLEDDPLRSQLATAGRTAVSPLTVDAMAAATIAVYERATSA
jgi:glycosyltransferase involved in cell wall biosynthesis